MDCMAPYGGPVEATIGLGGFPETETGPNYRLATGIILTYLVTNKLNKDELGPALEWEKRFVTFLENYDNELMDIAYNAERSIEDGIEAMSEAEMYTVIISYVVMFVYITIALGRIRGCGSFLVSL
jgi:Niemann-Pick C1 protein